MSESLTHDSTILIIPSGVVFSDRKRGGMDLTTKAAGTQTATATLLMATERDRPIIQAVPFQDCTAWRQNGAAAAIRCLQLETIVRLSLTTCTTTTTPNNSTHYKTLTLCHHHHRAPTAASDLEVPQCHYSHHQPGTITTTK